MGRGKTFIRTLESELELEDTFRACLEACERHGLKVSEQEHSATEFTFKAGQSRNWENPGWPTAVEAKGRVNPQGLVIAFAAYRSEGHVLAQDDVARRFLDAFVATLKFPLRPQAAARVLALGTDNATSLARSLEIDEVVKVVFHGHPAWGDAAVGTDRRLFSLRSGQILGWPYREVRGLRVEGSALRFKAPVPLHAAILWNPCAVNLGRRQDWEDDWARLKILWRYEISRPMKSESAASAIQAAVRQKFRRKWP